MAPAQRSGSCDAKRGAQVTGIHFQNQQGKGSNEQPSSPLLLKLLLHPAGGWMGFRRCKKLCGHL